ncbi:MAG: hypothetical protein MUF87_13245 [Anaerolineae bacterium]|nr:hypothetical protein [Anaerolineae bacterium]
MSGKPTFSQRLKTTWRNLIVPGDLTTLIITIALLMMPVLLLSASDWMLEMRVIVPITLLGVLFGYLLARSRYDTVF